MASIDLDQPLMSAVADGGEVDAVATSKKKKTKKKKHPVGELDAGADDDLFRVISNPQKMLSNPRREKGAKKRKKKKRDVYSVHSMSSFSEYSSDARPPSSIGIGSLCSHPSFIGQMEDADGSEAECDIAGGGQRSARVLRREEIIQEKIEMLSRISKMSKQGYAATKKWGMRDDIDDIRFECYRMTRENNSKRAVKHMQHGLITLATILEFANNLINPFNLKLQGFSRSMMLTVSDYDDSLEAIHHKWSGRTSMGPELTVLFTFATSAVFHHAGNVSNNASASDQPPRQPKSVGGTGLGDMSSMLGLFSSLMSKGAQQPKTTVSEVETETQPSQRAEQAGRKGRRSMRGPSIPVASMSLP